MSNRIRIKEAHSFEREVQPPELETVTVLPNLTVAGWGVERHSFSQDDTGQGDYSDRNIIEVHLDEESARKRAESLEVEFGQTEYPYSGGDFLNMSGESYRHVGPFILNVCLTGETVEFINEEKGV